MNPSFLLVEVAGGMGFIILFCFDEHFFLFLWMCEGKINKEISVFFQIGC